MEETECGEVCSNTDSLTLKYIGISGDLVKMQILICKLRVGYESLHF